jgi:hypothetical protein
MKLVIRHSAPRVFRPACRQVSRLLREGGGLRGVSLRLRRPSKPVATAVGRNQFVDARTFIESRSENHLHFSQHLNLSLHAYAAAASVATRPVDLRNASQALRAQRHWRQAREWLRPASAAPAMARAAVESPQRAASATGFRAGLIQTRRPLESTSEPSRRTPRMASRTTEQGFALPAAPMRTTRTQARLQLAKREFEFQAEAEKPQRAITLRHRNTAAIRDRAQPLAEARQRARELRHATPVRPVTLIYRKAGAGPAPEQRGMDLMHLAQGEFRPRSANATPSSESAPAYRANLVVPRFDGGMLDGLADDIIRRIDKRARVERERRGI